jgi:DNA (cytosine-5)-methyltransferase 1
VEFELSDFCIYAEERNTTIPKKRKQGYWDKIVGGLEMIPLHSIRANKGTYPLLFDGVLSCGDRSYYVQAAPFGPLSIGGYGLDAHSIGNDIWIQSRHCRKVLSLSSNRPFYRLQQPRSEYTRYHDAFLWIADLGKHFVDYLQYNTDNKTNVRFSHFESDFHSWLIRHHGRSNQFRRWLGAFGRTDFRVAIAAHVEHLWTEAIDMNNKLRRHFLWKEVDPKALNAIPKQLSVSSKLDKTVVTPLVYETFKNIYFSSIIEARVATDPVVKTARRSRKKALGFMTGEYKSPLSINSPPDTQDVSSSINAGDVVGISRDVEQTSAWKNTKSEIWFGK